MAPLYSGLTRALLSCLLLLQPASAASGQVQARVLPSASVSPSASASNLSASTGCNGRLEYCNRSYSNITFMGSHDSPFVGPLPQQNQNINIKAQLNMGIRYLQAQTHHALLDDSVLELCHTSCLLEDAGTLKSFLVTIKNWLDANPNEVLTLLLTNGDSVGITEFGDTFSSAGIVHYAFVPSSNHLSINSWPTLGQLISSGKRLVVFLDYGADTTKVDYILDEFAYYFETRYDVTDPTFSNCSIDRPPGASAAGRMYVLNHFLDVDIAGVKIPDREAAEHTNAATGKGSIGANAALCEGLYGREPNVVLLDFVDQGNAMDAQSQLNGF